MTENRIEIEQVARPPRYVGARVPRVEDARLLTGAARYVDDISLRGMLHAAFLRSPYPHAAIRRIDVAAAKALEGVVAVVTGEDLKDVVGPFVTTVARPEVKTCTQRVLPIDKVRHVGEAVVLVVARSRYVAEDAIVLIEVDWEPLPAVVDAERALEPDAPRLHDDLGDNSIGSIVVSEGDVDAVFAQADHVFSKRFHFGRCSAAPLETRGVIAGYDAGTGELTIWTSSQWPYLVRTLLAGPLGIPESRLRVISPDVGGAFGAKAHVFVEEAIVGAAARLLGRPVKWIEDRYEHLAASIHAKEVVCYVDIATAADGTFQAFRGRFIGDGGAYSCNPHTPLVEALNAAAILPGTYDVQNVAYKVDVALTNKCQIGAYRAVGWTSGHTAREALIDEIGHALGVDPVELRLMNTIPPEPYTTALGQRYDGGSYAEALEKARDAVAYAELREEQARLREQGRYLGIGFSPYVEPTGYSTQTAKAYGQPAGFFDSATVTVAPDGSATVVTGFHSDGQGHETALAQVAADELGVRLEDVRVVQGDTSSAVYGVGTFGSRSAVIGLGLIKRAATDVRRKLLRVAAEALEVSEADLELYDGKASVRGVPERRLTMGEVALRAHFARSAAPAADAEPAMTSTRAYDPPETYSNGAVAAVVEVDAETGEIDVRRLVSVHDCGPMINPPIVEGQIAGGIAQAIGSVLLEEVVYDEDGQFLSGSLMDYLYPSTTEVPSIEIEHLETPSAVAEGGLKGIGQAGMIGAPAALVNAIGDALAPFGVSVTKTPIRPTDVLDLLERAQPVVSPSA